MNYTILEQLKQHKGKIVWLASYPKSGNTWLRAFLSSLISDGKININQLLSDVYFPSRDIFLSVTNLDSTYLTKREIEELRYEVYDYVSQGEESDRLLFSKIHDKCSVDVRRIIDHPSTKCIIYLIRNPLSIVGSFANHLNNTIDKTISVMADSRTTLAMEQNGIPSMWQFSQNLGSWSEHVESWTSISSAKLKVFRYEDMLLESDKTFKSILDHIGLDVSDIYLQRTIKSVHIDNLRQHEFEKGFEEKPMKLKSFFRTGKVDAWKSELTIQQQSDVISTHLETMNKYGYLEHD